MRRLLGLHLLLYMYFMVWVIPDSEGGTEH
jgi:hypothetical protein